MVRPHASVVLLREYSLTSKTPSHSHSRRLKGDHRQRRCPRPLWTRTPNPDYVRSRHRPSIRSCHPTLTSPLLFSFPQHQWSPGTAFLDPLEALCRPVRIHPPCQFWGDVLLETDNPTRSSCTASLARARTLASKESFTSPPPSPFNFSSSISLMLSYFHSRPSLPRTRPSKNYQVTIETNAPFCSDDLHVGLLEA